MRNPYQAYSFLTIVLFFILLPFNTQAQTPGLIYQPATNGGNKVLDPNGDGYVSKTAAGFTGTNDEGSTNSEIPYRPFPAMGNEPLNDLVTGSGGGHTDLAPSQSAGATGSPISAYFDGKNFLIRVRLGGQSTASKGYSVMIDSDGLYGNLVKGGNPATTPNPGFEFEIVLANNFDVSLYDHRGNFDGGPKIWTGSVDQYFQKSIAASIDPFKSNEDYFYDFYVPLTAFGGGITADTKLRMSGITITSAQSGITGTVSDIGGINFAGDYSGDARSAWKDVVSTFPPTSLNDLKNGSFGLIKAKPPIVNGPLYVGATLITGSSIEPAGSVVSVYQNGVLLGSPSVLSDGTWSLTITSSTLVAGQTVTATVKPTSKSLSDSSNSVVVAAGECGITPPVITGVISGNKGLTGTSTNSAGTITVYRRGTATAVATNVPITTGAWQWQEAQQGQSFTVGTYYAVFVPTAAGSCTSPSSNEYCFTGKSTGDIAPVAPSITAATVNALSGTATKSGVTVMIKKNGISIGTTTAATTLTSGSYAWSFSIASTPISEGDKFYAYTQENSIDCGTVTSSRSAEGVGFQTRSATPVITGTYCGTTTTVKGTSTSPAGTQIKIYVNGTALASPAAPHATVTKYGTWVATGLSIAEGAKITATATATILNRTESLVSNEVTVTAKASNAGLAISTNPIIEGRTSLTGTGTDGDIITLYIGGSPYPTTTTVSGGIWTISGISPLDLYAGAEVWVTANTASTCASNPSATKIVACTPPLTTFTVTTPTGKVCYNTQADITLSGSENGIIYNLYIGATRTGASVLGTGHKIILKTSNLTIDPTTVTVKATKVGAANCEPTVDAPKQVGVYSQVPNNYVLNATNLSGCPNASSAISVTDAAGGYTYQVYNVDKKTTVGDPVVHATTGTLTLPAVRIDVSGTYSVLIKNTTTGCQTENVNANTIAITRTGPDVSKNAYATLTTVCPNTGTNINFETQSGYTYKLFNKETSAQQVGTASVTGDGGVMSINTGNLAIGTYTFQIQATSTSPACTSLYTKEVAVSSGNGAAPVSAGNNATICDQTTYTLNGSDPSPGTGKWTQDAGNPAGASFSLDTDPKAVVSGLSSGSYTFTWTVTVNCGGSPVVTSKSVTIIINCPAEPNVRANKYVDEYTDGQILATFSDKDGGVSSASLAPGSSLPPGTKLNTTTGAISVDNTVGSLQPGTYTFKVNTIDSKGVQTQTPVTLRMYSRTTQPEPAPLPVEIVYFTASVQYGNVKLQWLTASETNNKGFEVERSLDGKKFMTIGSVVGNGTSSIKHTYSFTDYTSISGTTYYRLKQIDFDGKSEYSRIIAVNAAGIAESLQMQVYPNPFNSELSVAITALKNSNAELRLLDMQGRVVSQTSIILQQGVNELTLPLQSVRKGMYILQLTGDNIHNNVKVLKK